MDLTTVFHVLLVALAFCLIVIIGLYINLFRLKRIKRGLENEIRLEKEKAFLLDEMREGV